MKLVSVSEAAEEKGVSREAVYQAIRRGQLRTRRVLGRIGVVRTSLDGYEPRREKVEAGRRRAECAVGRREPEPQMRGQETSGREAGPRREDRKEEMLLARAAAGEARSSGD